ncbi:hypothetical protein [Serratia ficaria]|uniref:hypothetical protein n=1 Tax=Serratia ficaria TaxID=61651 RepID=UPI0021C68F80|nr:hypothetical protein [Serratia ficaria]
MTFIELEMKINGMRRKSEAHMVIACLVDAFDRGEDWVDRDDIAQGTNIMAPNISTAAKHLEAEGLIEIQYLDTKADQRVFSPNRNGNWSKPFYRISAPVLRLFNRSRAE